MFMNRYIKVAVKRKCKNNETFCNKDIKKKLRDTRKGTIIIKLLRLKNQSF